MRRLATTMLMLLIAMPLAARQQALSKPIYQALQQAQALMEKGDVTLAIDQLQMLMTQVSGRPYEQAVVLQTLAHAHISRQDYRAAIPLLERSLALDVLPVEAQQRLRYNLAQLYLATEAFEQAVALLKQHIARATKPHAEAHALLGSAHLQLKQYQKAIAPLKHAIALSQTPKESWYQGLLGAHHELKQYDRCAELLRRMIALFPQSTRYWRQLAGIELSRERFNDALAVLELAWRRGHLDSERDLLQLAQLYLHRAEPYKAARLMEGEIARGRLKASGKHWRLTADAWYQARETARAIAALERSLRQAQNAETGLRLARLYLESERPQKARAALQRLLELSGLEAETRGRAWLLLGMACYQVDLPDKARVAFDQASRYAATRKDAGQWLSFLAAAE